MPRGLQAATEAWLEGVLYVNSDFPQVATPQASLHGVFVTLIDLLDELRHAKSLADVNIAAGKAWQGLASAELGLFAEPVEFAAHGPDELGEVVDLPL